jgi:hypothetical protein
MKSLIVLALVLVPGLAAAQGYYNQPSRVPGGFHDRTGRLMWGGSIGLGGMHDNGSNITSCGNCNYNPLAVEGDFHVGGMLGPRFALMFEAQGNAQPVHSDLYNGDTFLTQSTAMIAGQYWLTPQLWIKGGLGFAHLQADDSYFTSDLGSGGAIMGAVGFELLSARFFAVDLQGRIIEGAYHGTNDHVTSGTVGIGLNWY